MDDRALGERIVALRAERGMTRAELGEAIGLSEAEAAEVAEVENGTLLPEVTQVALEGMAFGLTLAEVLGVERHGVRALADRVMREPVDPR